MPCPSRFHATSGSSPQAGFIYPKTYCAHKSGVRASCHHLGHTRATRMLNAGGNLVAIRTLPGHSRITTTDECSQLNNATARRDYFKAMRFITEKSQHESESKGGHRNFFTKERRQQVYENVAPFKLHLRHTCWCPMVCPQHRACVLGGSASFFQPISMPLLGVL